MDKMHYDSIPEEYNHRLEQVVGESFLVFRDMFKKAYFPSVSMTESEIIEGLKKAFLHLNKSLKILRSGNQLADEASEIEKQVELIFNEIEKDDELIGLLTPFWRDDWLIDQCTKTGEEYLEKEN